MRRRAIGIAAGVAVLAVAAPVLLVLGQDGDEPPGVTASAALGNEFTYQGRLTQAGVPANGAYDLRFILFTESIGGAQVGPIVTRDDVQVSGGLFNVLLDFGPTAFQGDLRWLEIHVRPGASVDAYAVLSPRQQLTAAPQALFAKVAAALQLPFNEAAQIDGGQLFYLGQTGDGVGLNVQRTYDGSSTNPAILGGNLGSGAGVLGLSNYTDGLGYGVIGSGVHPGNVGVLADGPGGAGTALEVRDGALKVSGSPRTAFVHVATIANTDPDLSDCGPSGYCTIIDHPLTNGDATAILIVTQNWSVNEVFNAHPIGVWYDGTHWQIFNQDLAAMPAGAAFNVLVIKQ
jgi:hypothetical protein